MEFRKSVVSGAAVALLACQVALAGVDTNAWVLPNFAQRLELNIANRSPKRVRGLASVRVQEAAQVAAGFPGTLVLAVIANPPGAEYPFAVVPSQVDDLDGDGTADEVVFQVELGPNETRRAYLYYSTTLHDAIPYPKGVEASHNFGYNRQTAALESERIGYRTYGGFFLDVQARAKGNPGLNNSLVGYIGSTHAAPTGLDVLHIGDTLGLGGIFLRQGKQLYQPPFNMPDYAHKPSPADAPKYRVVSRGPLRATIEASMDRWAIGKDAVRISARYSIAAGEEFALCDVEITPLELSAQATYEVGAGVRRLPQEKQDLASGRIALTGTQTAEIGALALSLFYDPAGASPVPSFETGEGGNEAVVFQQRLRAGHAVHVRYAVAAAWSGSGYGDLLAHIREVEQAFRQQIEVSGFASKATPTPERIEGEAD